MRLRAGHLCLCLFAVHALAVPGALVAQTAEAPTSTTSTLLLERLVPTPHPALGGGDVLALAEVLESVARHHPALENMEARADVAEGLLLSAEGTFDPLLAVRGSLALFGYYEYGRADVFVVLPTPLYGASFFLGWRVGRGLDTGGFPEYYGYDETLDGGELRGGVTVPLLRDGWIDGRRAGITRAERGVEAAAAELEARRLRVALAATEAYWRWVAAGLRLAVAHHLLELAEVRDEQLAARVRAGALPPIEHLENRRSVLERRQIAIASRRALERSAITLSLYVRNAAGRPTVPTAAMLPAEIAETTRIVPDEATAISSAMERRPELARLRAVRAATDVSAELADNQILPRLDVTLSASGDLGGTDDSTLVTQLASPVGEAMVVLSFPLALREARGRADAAHAEVRGVLADAELMADTIAIEVRDALSAVAAATEGLAIATASAALSERVAAGEQSRFDAGATTLLIVNLREVAAAQAEGARIDALADAQVAHALLRATTAASGVE